MTALASIMPMTFMVSSAHTTRSVRGVGWCSMVRLAPRIHRPCAVGAISTGKPASTPTASPRPMPAAARPPAMRRARSWTSPQVWRTGAWGSPVTMPFFEMRALRNIFSVNLLTQTSSVPACPQGPGFHVPPRRAAVCSRRASTVGKRLDLELVMEQQPRVRLPDRMSPARRTRPASTNWPSAVAPGGRPSRMLFLIDSRHRELS